MYSGKSRNVTPNPANIIIGMVIVGAKNVPFFKSKQTNKQSKMLALQFNSEQNENETCHHHCIRKKFDLPPHRTKRQPSDQYFDQQL